MSKSSTHIALSSAILMVLLWNSIAPRWQEPDQPLGRAGEFITAHLLMTLDIWERGGGPSQFHFSPVFTYPEPGNKNMDYFGGLTDENGDSYYISYPPFVFLFTYYLFHLLGVAAGPLPIQVLGLVVHALTSVLFYFFVLAVYDKKITDRPFLPALAACALYLFNTSHLWFHHYVWFVDFLAQPLFVAQALLMVLLWRHRANQGRWFGLGVFAIDFLAIYTEWLGLFMAGLCFLFCAASWIRGERAYGRFALIHALAIAGGVGLIFWQYSSIQGVDAFLQAAIEKFRGRSGLADTGWNNNLTLFNDDAYLRMIGNYKAFYPIFLVFFMYVIGGYLIAMPFRPYLRWTTREWGVLGLLAIPTLMHHVVFFNFSSQHGFSTIKTSLLLFFVVASIIHHLETSVQRFQLGPAVPFAVTVFLLIFVIVSYREYARTWGRQAVPPDYQHIASLIQKHAEPKDIVFTNFRCAPETMFYAGRNFFGGLSRKDSALILRDRHCEQGLYVAVEDKEGQREGEKKGPRTYTAYRLRADGESSKIE